jgi:phenylacetate-CoA ligase
MRRMMKITGRSDDMMIVRGVNVFPSQIEELILGFPALAPHYQIELSKAGNMDAVMLRIELASGANKETAAAEAGELVAQIKALIGISCGTLLCDEGGIPRSEGKAKRVVDRR